MSKIKLGEISTRADKDFDKLKTKEKTQKIIFYKHPDLRNSAFLHLLKKR